MTKTELTNRVEWIKKVIELAWEVEDEWLEYWLMLGCPDDESDEELYEDVEDDELFKEWVRIGKRVILERKKQGLDF